ncbi:MAG: hypothetical protein U0X40_10065 [Ferruginibacter sp.]
MSILCLLSVRGLSQDISFSRFDKEDNRDVNFEIIGKFNDNILVYKNIYWRHKISIFDKNMQTVESVKLDFMPEKTFNVDFVTYPGFFYMIYQYQKRNILHCMAVKMDASGKKLSEPVEIDTTQIPILTDNKIYSTISSEDKSRILVFKVQQRNEKCNIASLLLDSQLNVIRRSRHLMEFDDRREGFSEFSLTNDGDFIFTLTKKNSSGESSNVLQLAYQSPASDSLKFYPLYLGKKYIDEVKMKVDNLNKNVVLNAFYYSRSRGSVEGLYTAIWDKQYHTERATTFTVFDDEFRSEANSEGLARFAFDNFFIHEIFVKKDGGLLVTAEDFSSQTRGSNNPWNRWDYLNTSPFSNNSYYYYSPYYGYYRPLNSFSNTQSVRYYYDNIIVISIDKEGHAEWNKVIHKSQFDDDDDNFLSYSTMNGGGKLHFLFNADSHYQIVSDQTLSPTGDIQRNATLKSLEKGYRFMPKLSKQVGSRELIIPCVYREYVCFARVQL